MKQTTTTFNKEKVPTIPEESPKKRIKGLLENLENGEVYEV